MFQTFRLYQPTPISNDRPAIGANRSGRYLPGNERNAFVRRTSAYGRVYGRRAPVIEVPQPTLSVTPMLSTIASVVAYAPVADTLKLDHAA